MNLKLKAKIIEIHGTQADFARALGKNESYVSRVVRGRKSIPEKDIQMWVSKLNCKHSFNKYFGG